MCLYSNLIVVLAEIYKQSNLIESKCYWSKLRGIPVNENDELDEDFDLPEREISFEKSTDKFDVWHWVEQKQTYNISIVRLNAS